MQLNASKATKWLEGYYVPCAQTCLAINCSGHMEGRLQAAELLKSVCVNVF